MAEEENNKLHVPEPVEGAPPDTNEAMAQLIKVSQEMVDRMQDAKNLDASGGMDLAALALFAKQQKGLLKQLPHGKEGPPKKMSMQELEALAKQHEQEVLALVKEEDNSAFSITMDDLTRYSKMPPQEVVQDFKNKLEAHLAVKKESVEEQNEAEAEAEEKEEPELKTQKDIALKERGEEFMEKITNLLFICKLVFHDLKFDWKDIEVMEIQMGEHLKFLKEEDPQKLLDYMLDKIENAEDEEEKLAAAFVLASNYEEDKKIFDTLIKLWEKDEEIAPIVIQALKFSRNPNIDDILFERFLKESPPVMAGMVEVFNYHRYEEKLIPLWEKFEPFVQAKIVKKAALGGIKLEYSMYSPLLEDWETPFFQDVVLATLLNGEVVGVGLCRNLCMVNYEEMDWAAIYLACSGNDQNLPLIEKCLTLEKPKGNHIKALGIFGLVSPIPQLIERLKPLESSYEEFTTHQVIHESLELIVGANLLVPPPDIEEGPKGEEEKVQLKDEYFKLWSKWWADHQGDFDETIRYRRGNPLSNLGDLIDELEFPRANYWSRQICSYEIMMRGGHTFPFEANWYVPEQKAAIKSLREWWQENQTSYVKSPWLFANR